MSDNGMKITEVEDGVIIEHPDNWVVNWNEDLEILKYRLQTLLKDNIVEVTFTKVDGTTRVMKCTLKPTLIPDSAFLTADEKERKHTVPEHVLPVWDIEKNAWRSFRIENVYDYIVTKV